MTQYQEKIVGKPGGLVEPGVKQYGFLKKIFKPVKKIAKKVWKSPLGKAALIGGGLYGLGGLKSLGGTGIFKGGQGLSRFGNLAKMFKSKGVLGDLLYSGEGDKRKFSLGKAGLMGLLGAGVAMPFMGGDDEEEIIEEPWENTPASIANIAGMARNRDPSLSFLPSNVYTQSGFYAADGGLAKLANGGGVAEAQAEQMLKMQYQKYRNQGGTMSYQQFKMTVLKQAQGQGPMAQEHLQAAAQGGRIGYQRGGPPGGGDRGMRGTGQSYGSSYGPGRDRGWNPGVGGTPHIPTPRSTPDRFPDKGIRDINPQINLPQRSDPMKDYVMRTHWKNILPGGDPFRTYAPADQKFAWDKRLPTTTGYALSLPIKDDIYKNYDEEKEEDITIKSPTSGYENLDVTGQAQENKIKKDAAMQAIYEAAGWDIPKAQGGRVGLLGGGPVPGSTVPGYTTPVGYNKFDYRTGGIPVRVRRAEGGLMSLGGMEKDYRQEGGFVPLGKKEKADDVPARLSKNEFVFTADAVRNAGGGDIDAGAEVMQNVMDNLEQGGQISEESQGAQGMYNNMQQLQSRMA